MPPWGYGTQADCLPVTASRPRNCVSTVHLAIKLETRTGAPVVCLDKLYFIAAHREKRHGRDRASGWLSLRQSSFAFAANPGARGSTPARVRVLVLSRPQHAHDE